MNVHEKLDDHQLMRGVADGDAEAFEALISRWAPKILRVLRRLTDTEQDAEDLLQETFFRVLDSGSRYRAKAAFSTWLYRIVINLARDAARRNRCRKVALDNEADRRIEPLIETLPEQQAQQRELVEQVEAALAELPSAQREIIVLKHYSDLTFREIAEAVGAPASTVKSRAAAGLRELRAALLRRGVDGDDVKIAPTK